MTRAWRWLALLVVLAAGAGTGRAADPLRFAILGDRTGETQSGVYERVWQLMAAAKPAFVVGVGDSIQGLNAATAEAEWREVDGLLEPFRKIPMYFAAGNHDVWSADSEKLFEKHTGHAVHYSFDSGQAHFTVLDNSRSDELAAGELEFLEADLKAHAGQAVKVIVSHRPSWLFPAALRNTEFPLHQIAKRYGVKYVIAGHVHQMVHLELNGVTYISMPSAGGHLRASGAYEDGWFFGYAMAEARGGELEIEIREATAPYGEGRVSKLSDWGLLGLVNKPARKAAAK
jgi:predicted phosphodiesterase